MIKMNDRVTLVSFHHSSRWNWGTKEILKREKKPDNFYEVKFSCTYELQQGSLVGRDQFLSLPKSSSYFIREVNTSNLSFLPSNIKLMEMGLIYCQF